MLTYLGASGFFRLDLLTSRFDWLGWVLVLVGSWHWGEYFVNPSLQSFVWDLLNALSHLMRIVMIHYCGFCFYFFHNV